MLYTVKFKFKNIIIFKYYKNFWVKLENYFFEKINSQTDIICEINVIFIAKNPLVQSRVLLKQIWSFAIKMNIENGFHFSERYRNVSIDRQENAHSYNA